MHNTDSIRCRVQYRSPIATSEGSFSTPTAQPSILRSLPSSQQESKLRECDNHERLGQTEEITSSKFLKPLQDNPELALATPRQPRSHLSVPIPIFPPPLGCQASSNHLSHHDLGRCQLVDISASRESASGAIDESKFVQVLNHDHTITPPTTGLSILRSICHQLVSLSSSVP